MQQKDKTKEDLRHPHGKALDGEIGIEWLQHVFGNIAVVDGGVLVLLELWQLLLADVDHYVCSAEYVEVEVMLSINHGHEVGRHSWKISDSWMAMQDFARQRAKTFHRVRVRWQGKHCTSLFVTRENLDWFLACNGDKIRSQNEFLKFDTEVMMVVLYLWRNERAKSIAVTHVDYM